MKTIRLSVKKNDGIFQGTATKKVYIFEEENKERTKFFFLAHFDW